MRHSVPFLTLLILLPAIAALVLGLLGLDRRLHREVSFALALLASLATLVIALIAFATMREHDGGFQLVSNHMYTGTTLGVHWYLGVDGISIFLVLLTALLFPLAIVLGRNRENSRAYFAWILLLEAAVMGSFVSLDLLVFFFMFELTLVPSYFIIAGWGHQRRAYAALKFFLYTFLGSAFLLVGILTLAVIGIVYGAVVACAQRDLKRIVAYSSLAQIGSIALGTVALSTQGLSGGVLLMLNHGLIVAALFILIGFIYERRGTWQAGELRGLQKAAPVLAGVFTLVMLASIGVPGLNGFVSEFLVLSGTFITHRWWAVVAVLGVIVAAIYLLWAYQQVFHGTPREADAKTRDLAWLERLVMAPLVILIVFLGVYPKPVLDRINPSVNQLIAHVEQSTGQHQPPVAVKGVEGVGPGK